MAKVPVMSDMTGQQLVKAQIESNALLSDVLMELKKLNGVVETPAFVIKGRVSKTRDENGKVTAATLALDTSGADIYKAHEEGWPLVLWVDDTIDGGKYSIPYYHAIYNENTANPAFNNWTYSFVSLTANNPVEHVSTYVISHYPTANLTTPSVVIDK